MDLFSSGCDRTMLALWLLVAFAVLFGFVGIPLIVIFTAEGPQGPIFSVETTAVKAYNLTSDNRLFCIINIGFRAHNPNLKKHSLRFWHLYMDVRKGKHHALADDALLGFEMAPGGDAVLAAEAVGLRFGLKRKIGAEMRADVAAGEGRVNVFVRGIVGYRRLEVTCKNVAVDFSMSMARVDQKVDCKVKVSTPGR